MPNKIITKENEKYGYWKVLEPNVVSPETTAKTMGEEYRIYE